MKMISLKPAYRMLREPDKRLLWKFAWNFGWQGMRSVRAFERRRRKGEPMSPAFVFISVTEACNLRCQGCWVGLNSGAAKRRLSGGEISAIIEKGRAQGVRFFGILGGEPLLHPDLLDIFDRFPDCYFQLFTNGTMLNDEIAARLRQAGNVTPLISVEGSEEVSDIRRGGHEVFRRTLDALDACRRQRLIFGVATSVCKSNLEDLVSENFVREMAKRGALYLWYYIYRPVGPRPTPELALSEEEILRLRRFIVDIRMKAPLGIVDAYWNEKGEALCPAATGISHHVGPGGDIEPCPPIQFARENIREASGETSNQDPFAESDFLQRFREFSASSTRGCVLLECPEKLHAFLTAEGARDTSGRGTGMAELAQMRTLPGHHMPGREIPEKHPFYYFAKKHWFFGFGAYG